MDHPLRGFHIVMNIWLWNLLEIPGRIGESSLSIAAKMWRGDDSTKV